MLAQKKTRQYALPLKLQPYRDEGPQGYLLRLAENNLLTLQELKAIGIIFDYDLMLNQGILVSDGVDPDLHRQMSFISMLWQSETRIWNTQYARFCPHCLAESGYWKVEWELNFYDVCHQHQVWLVDQCSSCGNKISWNRNQLGRCSCGSILHAEQTKECPANMADIAKVMSAKILQQDNRTLPLLLQKTDVEQTQRMIRYLGNYMFLAAGKNPLKMRQAGDLNHSWPVTSLAAEVIADWPTAFHHALTQLEKQNRVDGRPSLNEVFGQAYHYVFKALKEKPFEELKLQFELWINAAWKGGIAKRNKRLTSTLMKQASWVPASVACDFLGISHQRLDLLIREGTIEGETHISEKGRKFVMVRRDNLQQVKDHLFGLIDMTTAGKLLGIQKRRMRQLLTLVFADAKKLGTSASAPWAVSRLEVNRLLELSIDLEYLSIPDEGCVSLGHVLRYWTWSNEDIAGLILSVKTKEIIPTNLLDSVSGIAAWNFKESELKNWKLRNQNGMGTWLTITQAANILGIKEQVAYELVSLGYLQSEVMPKQVKRGTRIRRSTIDAFNKDYIFATKIAEAMSCSPRKVINHLASFAIYPISGPQLDGARQVLYKHEEVINSIYKGL
ncbi:MAG: hypothetical protein CTY12_01905 [Methylotenera sp.]|nr:MAG: hypothetical protein CTY12_01905 [Methylotenera sp.]